MNFHEYWMSWNTCLLLMKPYSSEVSGSKISSFCFCNFQKKLFTTHKYKCSLKFWLECVMWGTLSFNTVICGKIESVSVCVCVYVCVYILHFDMLQWWLFQEEVFWKKKCLLGHLAVSEALAVHAGVIEKVLIPKWCSYFLWNRSPETEVVDQGVSSPLALLFPASCIGINWFHSGNAPGCALQLGGVLLCDLCWI